MATTLVNPTAGFRTYALQARTDDAGDPVDDVTGEDLRLMASLFSEGVVGEDSFQVTERGAGANMSVDVGSGAADADLAVVAGTVAGQGNYVVRLGDAVTNVPLNASNVSNPRIDEIYLVVQDNQYDSSGRVLARLAYRDGTPAATPAAPGPDANWDAYLLLASVLVGAGVTSVTDANITDERVASMPVTPPNPALFEVDGYAHVSSASSTNTDGSKASVSLQIPADWKEWRLYVIATMMLSTIGDNHESDLRIRVGGSDSASMMATVQNNDAAYPTVIDRRAGLTVTGSVTPALRAVRTGTASGTLSNIMMYARAVRTA